MSNQQRNFQPGEVDRWVRYQQRKHICQCGCDQFIEIKRHHAQKGIPQFLPTHRKPGYRHRRVGPIGTIPADAPSKFPCSHPRTLTNSYFNRTGNRYRCRICANDKAKKSPWRRTERGRELHTATSKRRIVELKLEMIAAYGGKCTCCGVAYPEFLTLEHLFRDGKAERDECRGNYTTVWYRLKQKGWPKDRYTILCWNCNMARRFGEECPHQRNPPSKS